MTYAATPPIAIPNDHPSAVADFVRTHQAGIWRWLRALGCESQLAEEHCQDALLSGLHHRIDELPEADARRWLRTASRNLFWMRLRQERRRPRHIELAPPELAELEAAWQQLQADDDGGSAALTALSRCMLTLPAADRDLLARAYEHGESRAAMAAARGVGEPAIKQALRRLRTKLKECVQRRLTSPVGRNRPHNT